jgi:tetratricopeptide (TPR) repeat protein/serine/threonine protein kinase
MSEQEIYIEAINRRDPAERRRFLDEVCAGNEVLRGRIETLIRQSDQLGSFLEHSPQPFEASAETSVEAEDRGNQIGPYKLIEHIGDGGMGTVWMAQQTEPVKRVVALKLIKAGMDSKQVIARFDAERQALALMDHPNIARVLDGGTTGASRPYFVMDLVKGVPITKYCDEHHLTPRQRLELFIPVCQAIQHAHQKGIIHRDLKPSNVLIALYDGKPVPKVIDFGVAKATGQSLTDKTLVTGFGNIVGTLEYMSPEQAEVNQLDIDTRSDIYSLGVLLYELLTGSPPFSRKELEQAGMLEMLRVIREEEPSKPSTKLSTAEGLPTLAANRGTEPAKLTKLVRGELDWIVMKALEKDRNRRYETANGFAMDVQRYLADEAVQACPPSAGYRLRKFARRNKGGLAVAALVLFFLVLLGSGVGWAVRDRAAREAEAARERAERQTKVAAQVDLIIAEADWLMKEQKWDAALAVTKRAEAVVTGGEADAETAQRVSTLLKDLEFIDRLEQIRLQKATWVEGKFDYAGAERDYARAFRNYGVDALELPVETSIDRLKARPALAIPVAVALDDWAWARCVLAQMDAGALKPLVAVARGIDPEPLRDRLRSAWGRPISEVQDDLRRLAESIDVRGQHPATLLTLARTLHRVDHPNSALRVLRNAQSANPGDFWLNFELAVALRLQEDYEGATRFYTAAVSVRPNATAAHNNLGAVLERPRKLDEAIACYRKAIEIDPKFEFAHNNLGRVLGVQQKLDEAIACYRKAIEINPKFTDAHFNLGTALADQQKLDEAIAAYRKANEINPKYAPAYINLGWALNRQKKWNEAADALNKAIEINPNDAAAYSNLGEALDKQGKLDDAIAAYRRAVELDPKDAKAHYNLGFVLSEQKKLDEAIDAYRKAIELDPQYAKAHRGLGNALVNQRKWTEAVAAYRKAIELDPKNADAHLRLGIAMHNQKKWDEAADAFRKAIEINPKYTDVHSWLGAALLNQGKLDDAIAACRKALEFDPKNADARPNLVNALGQKGWGLVSGPDPMRRDPERAIVAIKEAVELDPRSTMAWQWLGWVQYRLGDWRASIEALEKSRKLQEGGTGDSGQWIVLALAHARLAAQDGMPEKEREHHKAEARRWFDGADKLIDTRWRARPDLLMGQAIWDFRAEARELIAVKDGKK